MGSSDLVLLPQAARIGSASKILLFSWTVWPCSPWQADLAAHLQECFKHFCAFIFPSSILSSGKTNMAQTAVAQRVLWRREKKHFCIHALPGCWSVCCSWTYALQTNKSLLFFFSVCVPQSHPERGSQYLEELCLLKAEKLVFEVC